MPVDRLEIVQDGAVIKSLLVARQARRATVTLDVPVARSGWFAARAFGTEHVFPRETPPFAHTSPVYVRVGGASIRSPEDAAWLIRSIDRTIAWVDSATVFPDEAARAETRAYFRNAKPSPLLPIAAAPTTQECPDRSAGGEHFSPLFPPLRHSSLNK